MGKNKYEAMIPVSRPSVGKDELAAVKKVFDSGWLGMGKWVFSFEEELKKFLDAKYVIAVNTGTSALHLALDALGIGEGDEVIVPSLTFVASLQAIAATGAKPVFCDIDGETLNMDLRDAERRISKKTRAVMSVHYGGQPCDINGILKTFKRKKIRVVEDAAHAFGSSYNGRKVGSSSDIACFSFDPIKNISCGEGGCISTGDSGLANVIYRKRILGIDKDTWSRYKHKRDWFYSVGTLGFRYHMSNVNAAIGLVQLKKIGMFNDKKRAIAKRYDDAFGRIDGITLLKRDYEKIAPFNYVIRIKKGRERFMQFMKERGIDVGVHYIPNHHHPFFKRKRVALPETEKVWKEIVTLPLFYDISDGETSRVIDSVKRYFTRCRK